MSKKTTLADVARLAGVSSATVSMTLSGKNAQSIGVDTQARVKKVATDLGYVFKPRSPKTGKKRKADQTANNNTIVLIVDKVNSHEPFSSIFEAIREKALQMGFITAIYETGGNEEYTRTIFRKLKQEKPVGTLLAAHITRSINASLLEIYNQPLVLLNCYVEKDNRWSSVLPGDLMGGYLATQHLIDRGYQNIAHITGELNDEAARERREGYQRALISSNRIVYPALIREGGWYMNDGYRETRELLKQDIIPDAIFCGNDNCALGCYFALREKGLNIPQDIAIVGYDNSPVGEQMSPQLSSIELPYAKMAEVALELLITSLSKPSSQAHIIKMESTLKVRGSSE